VNFELKMKEGAINRARSREHPAALRVALRAANAERTLPVAALEDSLADRLRSGIPPGSLGSHAKRSPKRKTAHGKIDEFLYEQRV
jgi:hypothetical protein